MLTANDIHNKQFKRSFRGYDEDEIDEFLDQVVNDFDLLSRENISLKADLARAEKTNAEYVQLKDDINNTLLMAQKTAADQMASSKKAAQEQRENVAKECQNMKREAEIAAEKTLNDAKNEGTRILNEAKAQAQAVIAEYDRLVRAKNRYLRHIKQSLESQLAVVDQTLREVPDPDNVESGPDERAAQSAVPMETAAPQETAIPAEKSQETAHKPAEQGAQTAPAAPHKELRGTQAELLQHAVTSRQRDRRADLEKTARLSAIPSDDEPQAAQSAGLSEDTRSYERHQFQPLDTRPRGKGHDRDRHGNHEKQEG